jgi:hypothetical protein
MAHNNKSGEIGTAAESAVTRVLRDNGFPHAERRRLEGRNDRGDITGTPGICWEVKGGNAARRASDLVVQKWLMETEQERVNSHSDIGVLVVQRANIGAPRAGLWWAILPLGTLSALDVYGGFEDRSVTDWMTSGGPTVRMFLIDLLPYLRRAGYGNPLDMPRIVDVAVAGDRL